MQSLNLPNISSNYLSCGCHAHTTPPPSTVFNINLHQLLSQANDQQIANLFSYFQTDIYRILLSQFVDRITLQKRLSFDQQSHYMNIFNHILNPSSSKPNTSYHHSSILNDPHQQQTDDDNDTDNESLINIEDVNTTEFESTEATNTCTLPDDVWSRIFQFVDQETHLLSLPLSSRNIYNISTSPSSWISLQINCSPIYFNFKKSYLFSNFLFKSGRCLTSLVLRDIGSINEQHWKHFINFMTYCCPKIRNVRIRSSMTQNGMNQIHRNRNNRNGSGHTHYDESSLFHQLIGSNLHRHEYHHYMHNHQMEHVLKYSNAVKSNIFNTLKVFIKHYKKYGGLLIPQNTTNINNINHANHLSSHRITAIDSSVDDSLGNIMLNMLRNDIASHDDHINNINNINNINDDDDKKNDESIHHLLQLNDNKISIPFAMNPFFYIVSVPHDLLSYFSFSHQIGKYERNELQSEIYNNVATNGNGNNTNNNATVNINILESFCTLSLHQLKTNCVIRPKHLCSFLQKQPHLVVLKASVRYRRDWSESENEWFWKIPSYLPSNLEIFFLPGHHALPEQWVENCLAKLKNLSYFDFFIVNNKYIPSVSINTIYILAKHCHKIQFVHLHINLDGFLQKCLQKGDNEDNTVSSDDVDPYVLFTKELGTALQILFANCLELQRVYCYLPIKFDPSLLLQQIVFVQLPSKRKCKLRIDEYKIGGVKCRRFVFKLMDDVNALSKLQ